MKIRHLLAMTAQFAVVFLVVQGVTPAEGQDSGGVGRPATPRPMLVQPERISPTGVVPAQGSGPFDASRQAISRHTTSDVRSSRMTAAEIRQARALHRSQQRAARHEYNLWMGREPLRPSWNSVPMMSSRYSNRRVYVPVFVYPR